MLRSVADGSMQHLALQPFRLDDTTMKTQHKLLAAFGVLALLVLVTSGLGLRAATTSHHAFSDYVDGAAYRMSLANHVLDATNARAIAARNLVLMDDPARLAAEKEAVARTHKAVGEYLAKLSESATKSADPNVRDLIKAIVDVESRYGPVALDIVAKATGGDRAAAIAKMNAECLPLLAALLKAGETYLD